jgi:hypothetical protein
MRSVWLSVLVASVLLAALRPHHKPRRARAESVFAALTAGHHHHARSHRVRATIPGSPTLAPPADPIAERIVTASIEAPIAELATPVARGPPSS